MPKADKNKKRTEQLRHSPLMSDIQRHPTKMKELKSSQSDRNAHGENIDNENFEIDPISDPQVRRLEDQDEIDAKIFRDQAHLRIQGDANDSDEYEASLSFKKRRIMKLIIFNVRFRMMF